MVKEIVKDEMFLCQKSVPAARQDVAIGLDLKDTLKENRLHCVGMAANMIGVLKNIIIVNTGLQDEVMFNPVIVKKSDPFQAEEGCLSLKGTRKTTRYREIVLEFTDMRWKKQKRKFTGWVAQIIQHECDHLEGILI